MAAARMAAQHFEDDPVASDAVFNTAGVDAVTQRLTTVYQAGNADGASRIADEFTREMSGMQASPPSTASADFPPRGAFNATPAQHRRPLP